MSIVDVMTLMAVAIKFVAFHNITDWDIFNNQKVSLEITLLLRCKEYPSVIRLLDYYERLDGYLIVMKRPSSYWIFSTIFLIMVL
uniref:Uncharacterized protein n=1 Tax=Acrobeloides nanus TaxID=290746 RepID=A0A914EPL8_9BILA